MSPRGGQVGLRNPDRRQQPVFILEEANLGFLGLSAGEPYPTWGNLLRDLESPLLLGPAAFAPIAAIALSILCFKMIAPWRSSQV